MSLNPANTAQQKAQLRQQMRARRRALRRAELEASSAAVLQRLLSLEVYQAARTLCAYLAFDNEVETRSIIAHALIEKCVACPRQVSSWEMVMCAIEREDDLVAGAWGMPEPSARCPELSPETFDLILVPGLAFGRNQHRLGLGAGCYDRFLAQAQGVTIGLAHRFQIVEAIPPEAHDIPLDAILTVDETIGLA